MNTVLSRYLTDMLVLKNKKPMNVRIFSICLPIILLLVATFTGNVFMNSLICLTIPFAGTFVALENFMKKQKNPYVFALNPNYDENKKFIKNFYEFFNLSVLMSNISLSLLAIQLVLGDLNAINIACSLVLLGIVLFSDKNSICQIFNKTNKAKIMDIIQIVFVAIISIVFKMVRNVSLSNSIVFLIPIILISSIVLYLYTTKNLNILLRTKVEKISDKKYIDVKKLYDKELSHIDFMDRVMPVYDKETQEERKARIEKERKNQEIIIKSYGFKTAEEIVQNAEVYRARHAKIWLGNERVTPEEYDEFCRRYGYGKYNKKSESAKTLAKKEKIGGYVDVCDNKDATDRFNRKRR